MGTQPERPIRIVIVDDHPILRAGLRMIFESQPMLDVVGEATGCEEALAAVAKRRPHIILLDLELGDESSAALVPELLAAAPGSRVIMMSGLRNVEAYRQALMLGAMGLVYKEQTIENLLTAIAAVHAGEMWIERTVIADVLNTRAVAQGALEVGDADRIAALTAREREVIRLVGEGLRNKQIADRLVISEATVRHHMSSIFGKLGVNDRFELVIYAYRNALARVPR
jgi:two-component system nitrate/nitrite response regulator NarL